MAGVEEHGENGAVEEAELSDEGSEDIEGESDEELEEEEEIEGEAVDGDEMEVDSEKPGAAPEASRAPEVMSH